MGATLGRLDSERFGHTRGVSECVHRDTTRAVDPHHHSSSGDGPAEEVGTLPEYERVQIECHLHVLLMHLLRRAAEPAEREAWRSVITGERTFFDGLWEMSPSMRAEWPVMLAAS